MKIWDLLRRSRKIKSDIELLQPLITSKTRLKLLIRFFLNRNLSGYLQGLSKELEENTNSIRVELNRLESAGILSYSFEGRKKLYRVNKDHPLSKDLTNIVRKVAGVDALIDRVVSKLSGLKEVWILGDLAQGLQSNIIECKLIGDNLDKNYIEILCKKLEKIIQKEVKASIGHKLNHDKSDRCLLVWARETFMD